MGKATKIVAITFAIFASVANGQSFDAPQVFAGVDARFGSGVSDYQWQFGVRVASELSEIDGQKVHYLPVSGFTGGKGASVVPFLFGQRFLKNKDSLAATDDESGGIPWVWVGVAAGAALVVAALINSEGDSAGPDDDPGPPGPSGCIFDPDGEPPCLVEG